MTLDMEFQAMTDDTRLEFEEEFLCDLAAAAGVPRGLLQVTGVRRGSVVVDVTLARDDEDALGNGRSADEVVMALLAQAKDVNSKLCQGKHTHRVRSITPAEPLQGAHATKARALTKPAPKPIPAWRTVVVYLSSTLQTDRGRGDVEDERKVLYRDVLPELVAEYAQRMIRLLIVDPRLSLSAVLCDILMHIIGAS